MSNIQERLIDLNLAILNLKEASSLPSDSYINRDATIKRFELCFDLAWKILKHKLFSYGVDIQSPRLAFIEGVKNNLISDTDKWLDLIEMRNTAVHTYDSELADQLYKKIPNYISMLDELYLSCKAGD
jgi:nucleotidyltransferase substrate binding protein (TIGR01987 family)